MSYFVQKTTVTVVGLEVVAMINNSDHIFRPKRIVSFEADATVHEGGHGYVGMATS